MWVGGSKSYYSPSRALDGVYVGGNRSYGSPGRAYGVAEVGCSGSYCSPGRSYWGMCMLVDTAVPVRHTGWWMLVAVVRTAVPRGGCIGRARSYWTMGLEGAGNGCSRAHLSRRTGQWVVIHWVVLSAYG